MPPSPQLRSWVSPPISPPRVDVEDHAAHLAAMGCDLGVLVRPSACGQDHRCLLAALRRRPDQLRGVVCVPVGTPEPELAQMHAAGVRATRLQDGFPGGVPVQALVDVGHMVAAFGWHIEVWRYPLARRLAGRCDPPPPGTGCPRSPGIPAVERRP